MSTAPGVKHDHGKPDMSLLSDLPNALRSVVRVMEFGANKYSRSGFLTVPDGERRYLSAALRHLTPPPGETRDPESGEDHLDHAACCLLFLLEIKARKETNP